MGTEKDEAPEQNQGKLTVEGEGVLVPVLDFFFLIKKFIARSRSTVIGLTKV